MCARVCVCVPLWFRPALVSITADGVDKRNDRVRSSNRPDPAAERSTGDSFQPSSCLLFLFSLSDSILVLNTLGLYVYFPLFPLSGLKVMMDKNSKKKRKETAAFDYTEPNSKSIFCSLDIFISLKETS